MSRPSPRGVLLQILLLCLLFPALIYPLYMLLVRSVSDAEGNFVGAANFLEYLHSPGLFSSFVHSLTISTTVTALVVPAAFLLAYGLTHTRFSGRRICGLLVLLPLFVPSLLPAIGFVYLFGAQGIARFLLCGQELYGPLGIVLGNAVFTLPHATLLLLTSLRSVDSRLYMASACLGAGPWRKFTTVTLPNARYGIINASFVVFTLSITDFGVPKVLGGDYSVLSTEIFSQVIGQQNFTMGALISLVLMAPTVLTLTLDAWARRAHARLRVQNARPVSDVEQKSSPLFGVVCWGILLLPMASIAVVVFASFTAFWPYDMTLVPDNYFFEEAGYSLSSLGTSVAMALCVAVFGTALLYTGAYLVERGQIPAALKRLYRLLLLLPLSLPGLVLGLAYIFAFNSGPFSFLYDSFAILVINTIVHFSTVAHLTCVSALAKVDDNYEKAGRSMGVPAWKTALRVVVPQCRLPLSDVFFYLFINAMTTVSSMAFLCGGKHTVAAISIVNMYDSGYLGSAAAMNTLVLAVTAGAGVLHVLYKKIVSR